MSTCPRHPKYQAKRKPTSTCEECWHFYINKKHPLPWETLEKMEKRIAALELKANITENIKSPPSFREWHRQSRKCALQEGNCKAADCPQHGWVTKPEECGWCGETGHRDGRCPNYPG